MAATYSTISGDCWDLISFKNYGDEQYITQLIDANPRHRHTVIFKADIILIIPDRPAPSPAQYLPPWKRK